MQCVCCSSSHIIKKGFAELSSGEVRQRYKCKSCGNSFSLSIIDDDEEIQDDSPQLSDDSEIDIDHTVEVVDHNFERSEEWLEQNVFSKKRIVVASVQNNTAICYEFLDAIMSYCSHNDAGLIAIPIKYKTINSEDDLLATVYDDHIEPYLCENNIVFPTHNIKIYAGLRIQATAENPLSGLDPLSKGSTVIVGHAQVQLRTLPNLDKRISDILTTTGAITRKHYSKAKMAEKARFNHSLSALVIEFDETSYHLRHLNFDEESNSFCDLNKQYHSSGAVSEVEVEAIITGDEHALFRDEIVEKMTYSNDDSIVNVLRPKYIVRHDVLDAYSISHHHKHNLFTQYAKMQSGLNNLEHELKLTVDYINRTTPEFSTSVIVQSNHNEHLKRWLNEVDISKEMWNAKIYHYLWYNMLELTHMSDDGADSPDPFELVATPWLQDNVMFANRTNGMKILGIEVGSHGDVGVNGARGSAKSFARIPDKMIVGHSHSPSIEKGCYTVGTSSKLKLEYNRGASTWHHAHVIIHKNGKRQMIFITPDGWRLK